MDTGTQEAPTMHAEPQKEHHWLQKLVGDWTVETEMVMEPGKPAENATGTETVRSIGDIWFLAEGQGEMPGGGAHTSVMTLGYDPARQRFVGTFIASMMTHLWIYEGALESGEKKLTLEAEGPSMAGEGLAKYRDAIEFKSDDHRIMTSHMLRDNGEWQQIMTANYRRRK